YPGPAAPVMAAAALGDVLELGAREAPAVGEGRRQIGAVEVGGLGAHRRTLRPAVTLPPRPRRCVATCLRSWPLPAPIPAPAQRPPTTCAPSRRSWPATSARSRSSSTATTRRSCGWRRGTCARAAPP